MNNITTPNLTYPVHSGMNPIPRFGTYIILQYANGLYQGELNDNNQRHGKGTFFWNTGEFYYGAWENDQITGEGILYFSFGGNVYGEFLGNKVHGFGKLYFPNKDYILGNWEHGKLNGLAMRYFNCEQKWIICEYINGDLVKEIEEFNEILPNHIKVEFKNMENRDASDFLNRNKKVNDTDNHSNTSELCYINYENKCWYNGMYAMDYPNGLGILYYNEIKNDRGIFKNGYLDGLGRTLFTNGDIYDGFYRKGKYHGLGVYYKSDTNQYMYGMYENDICIQEIKIGGGYPHTLMRFLKANFHYPNAEIRNITTDVEILSLGDDDHELMENSVSKELSEAMESFKSHKSDKGYNLNGHSDIKDIRKELDFDKESAYTSQASKDLNDGDDDNPKYIEKDMTLPTFEVFTVSSKNNKLPQLYIKNSPIKKSPKLAKKPYENNSSPEGLVEDYEEDRLITPRMAESTYQSQADTENRSNDPSPTYNHTLQGLSPELNAYQIPNTIYKFNEEKLHNSSDTRKNIGYQSNSNKIDALYMPTKQPEISHESLKATLENPRETFAAKNQQINQYDIHEGQFETLGNHQYLPPKNNIVTSVKKETPLPSTVDDYLNSKEPTHDLAQHFAPQRNNYPKQTDAILEVSSGKEKMKRLPEDERNKQAIGAKDQNHHNPKVGEESKSKSPISIQPSYLENKQIVDTDVDYREFEKKRRNEHKQRRKEENSPEILEKKGNLLLSLSDLIRFTDDLNKLKKSQKKSKSKKQSTPLPHDMETTNDPILNQSSSNIKPKRPDLIDAENQYKQQPIHQKPMEKPLVKEAFISDKNSPLIGNQPRDPQDFPVINDPKNSSISQTQLNMTNPPKNPSKPESEGINKANKGPENNQETLLSLSNNPNDIANLRATIKKEPKKLINPDEFDHRKNDHETTLKPKHGKQKNSNSSTKTGEFYHPSGSSDIFAKLNSGIVDPTILKEVYKMSTLATKAIAIDTQISPNKKMIKSHKKSKSPMGQTNRSDYTDTAQYNEYRKMLNQSKEPTSSSKKMDKPLEALVIPNTSSSINDTNVKNNVGNPMMATNMDRQNGVYGQMIQPQQLVNKPKDGSSSSKGNRFNPIQGNSDSTWFGGVDDSPVVSNFQYTDYMVPDDRFFNQGNSTNYMLKTGQPKESREDMVKKPSGRP